MEEKEGRKRQGGEIEKTPQYKLIERRKIRNNVEGGDGVECGCGGRISGTGKDKDTVYERTMLTQVLMFKN